MSHRKYRNISPHFKSKQILVQFNFSKHFRRIEIVLQRTRIQIDLGQTTNIESISKSKIQNSSDQSLLMLDSSSRVDQRNNSQFHQSIQQERCRRIRLIVLQTVLKLKLLIFLKSGAAEGLLTETL